MRRNISHKDIVFEPASLIDKTGRVFRWNGNLYRGIRQDYTDFYKDLLERKDIKSLYNKGLIDAEITPLNIKNFDLVLKHRKVHFLSYCMEWSSHMLRDAALLICNLSTELYKMGLTIKDAHPWNILYDFGKPVYIDWGSIVPIDSVRTWPYREFHGWFLLPLYMMSAGLHKLARALMIDVTNRPKLGNIIRLLIFRIPSHKWLQYLITEKRNLTITKNFHPEYFHSIIKRINEIPIIDVHTEWTNYFGLDNRFSLDDPTKWNKKVQNVKTILNRISPKTLLDIGSNRGWISELASKMGIKVVAMDIDDVSINTLYHRTRSKGLSILPIIMDFCLPTPPHGLFNSYPGAEKRIQAEVVLALALTHHLVFKRNLTFTSIARNLALYSKRWLIVEFVPPDDFHVRNWMNEKTNWYSTEAFISALKNFFKRIDVLESYPNPRLLLVCEK